MNNTNYYNPIILSGDVVGKGYPKINNTIANGVIGVAKLSATGTPSSTTYLRGDNTWATISGGTGTVTSIGTSAPLTGGTITTSGTIGITQATTSTDGYLSSTDWTTFNNKFTLPSLTAGSVLFSNGTTIAQDNANLFWDDTNNRLGIGTSSPTARLNLPAGTASASSAPLKLTSGTNLTVAEAGAMEYNGTSLFFTRSGTLRAGILMTDIASPYNTYTASAKGATAFTTGANNVLVGFEAGKAMTTSSGSVFIGQQAGNTVVLDAAGGRSVALGAYSGTLTATLYGGVFIGYAAGYNSTSLSGSVMIGQAAGNGSATTQEAIFIGTTAGQGASGATYTIALGYQAAFGATSASNSVFIGQTAGHNALSAASTIGIGNNAGRNAHGSIESIYMGKNSGYNSVSTGITGDYNLGLGTDTLKAVTTGAGNIALGYKVGDTATTGSKNVAIGYDIDYQSNTADGQLTIQNIIFGKGNTGTGTTVSTGGIGIGGEPDACAMLEVKSTTKGFLLPRMTETERDAIASPVAGLMIYNTTTNKANLYTTAWEAITSA